MSKPSTHRPYASVAEQEHELRQLEQRELSWGSVKDFTILAICAAFILGALYQLAAWLLG